MRNTQTHSETDHFASSSKFYLCTSRPTDTLRANFKVCKCYMEISLNCKLLRILLSYLFLTYTIEDFVYMNDLLNDIEIFVLRRSA